MLEEPVAQVIAGRVQVVAILELGLTLWPVVRIHLLDLVLHRNQLLLLLAQLLHDIRKLSVELLRQPLILLLRELGRPLE